jgi:hypothetical protein
MKYQALTDFRFDTHGAIAIFFEAGLLFDSEAGTPPATRATAEERARVCARYAHIEGDTPRARARAIVSAIGEEADPLDREGALELFDALWTEGADYPDPTNLCVAAMDTLEDREALERLTGGQDV